LAWADSLTQFGRTEVAGGVVLVVALAAALVWANVDAHSYSTLWGHLLIRHSVVLPIQLHSMEDLVDNGLMTLFFLAIGLEMGREVAEGSLRDRRNVLLPTLAALGGMASAALVYLASDAALHPSVGISKGWGIPMATDVAFTLGAIALLGRRVPGPLRIFVLALAVADDVASVIVLAVVAHTDLRPWWLLGALATLAATTLMRRHVRQSWWPYAIAVVIVWYCLVRGGVEPTLGGAFVGVLVPMARGAKAGTTLEQPVHALSSYGILPLFVLANAGVTVTAALWHSSAAISVLTAIVAARTLGKMLGITVAVVLLVRLGVCNLPEGTTWRQMTGVSLLCGMGITVPLLFAHAVFGGRPTLFAGAQLGLLIGTLAAALLGTFFLLTAHDRTRTDP
jgi:NhaA family Na+:H+ antiporter